MGPLSNAPEQFLTMEIRIEQIIAGLSFQKNLYYI
jgi:hypothetical protein